MQDVTLSPADAAELASDERADARALDRGVLGVFAVAITVRRISPREWKVFQVMVSSSVGGCSAPWRLRSTGTSADRHRSARGLTGSRSVEEGRDLGGRWAAGQGLVADDADAGDRLHSLGGAAEKLLLVGGDAVEAFAGDPLAVREARGEAGELGFVPGGEIELLGERADVGLQLVVQHGVHSALSLPLLLPGQLVGAINVPIIYYSVKWWNTLHQGASVSMTRSPAMAHTMLWGMLLMALCLWMYSIAVALTRVRAIILERESHTEWVKNLTEVKS